VSCPIGLAHAQHWNIERLGWTNRCGRGGNRFTQSVGQNALIDGCRN
jgi:hypothetical protein